MLRRWITRLLAAALLAAAAAAAPASAELTSGVANTGLTVPVGGSVTVTAAELRVAQAGAAPAELTYRLTRAPAAGALLLSGSPLAPGGTFTQADIDAGRLAYAHGGGAQLGDSFALEAFRGAFQGLERVPAGRDDPFVGEASLSRDGRYVALTGRNIIPGLTSQSTDIYLIDRQTGQATRVTDGLAGDGAHWPSYSPQITPDGRFIVFRSDAKNLVAGDDDQVSDIFVYDRATGRTTVESMSTQGALSNQSAVGGPEISDDGRYVVFLSQATNLVPGMGSHDGGTWFPAQVFLRDRLLGTTTLVSATAGGAPANDGANQVALSGDGRHVAFSSFATNLISAGPTPTERVYVRDMQTGALTLVSANPQGEPRTGIEVAISGDGRYVAFSSSATDLVRGVTSSPAGGYIRDMQTGEVTYAIVASDGTPVSGSRLQITADGRYVAFASSMAAVMPGNPSTDLDIFVHDRQTGQTRRVSVTAAGGEVREVKNFEPILPIGPSSISDDGRFVAFSSKALGWVPGDPGGGVLIADTGLRLTVFVNASRAALPLVAR